jgi:hypothetical protein
MMAGQLTPLIPCIKGPHWGSPWLLIDRGADVDAKGSAGYTSSSLSACGGMVTLSCYSPHREGLISCKDNDGTQLCTCILMVTLRSPWLSQETETDVNAKKIIWLYSSALGMLMVTLRSPWLSWTGSRDNAKGKTGNCSSSLPGRMATLGSPSY